MYRRILVSFDGTPAAESAVRGARVLADAVGAELIELPTSADDSIEDRILAEAVARRADLIGLGTSDGEISHHVLGHAQVPVLTVGPNQDLVRVRMILVPFDGSHGAYVALGHAAGLARAARAALVLLRVVRPLPLWIFDPALGLNTGPLIDPRWDEDRRIHAEGEVRQVASKIAESGLQPGSDALLGEVAPTIVEYADQQNADLIVMGRHGRDGPLRALLGSTAEEVIRTAHQPVVVVGRDAAPAT